MDGHAGWTTAAEDGTEPAHGGRLRAAARRWPGAPTPWIDLSTGINPHAYPVPSIPAEAWTRLPEPEELDALEQAAAAAYGAPAGSVVAAPGTSALIAALAALLPQEAAIVGPTYGEYHAGWPGALVVPAPGPELMARPVRIVCQPDNPTGAVHDPAGLAGYAAGGWLLVDESYADFSAGVSTTSHLAANERLIVVRSFGKAYGLAGLRLGFALCRCQTLRARLRRALGPWPVSGPAIHIGTRALLDDRWRADAGRRCAADRDRLVRLLRRAGMRIAGASPLFVFADGGATGWGARLAGAGILVRTWPDRPGMLRIGLPPDWAWARLDAALR